MRNDYNPYAQQPQNQQTPSDLFPSLWANEEELSRATSACLARVFMRMFAALLVTAGVSYGVYQMPGIQEFLFSSMVPMIVIILLQFGLVMFISARAMSMPAATSNFFFFLYAILTGLTLSVIFLVYALGVIFQAFIITALTFTAMSVYGTITKRDLTGIGSIAIMALIGIIIASVINFFFQNEMVTVAVNYIGVLVFVALTAYHTQRIKNMLAEAHATNQEEAIGQISVVGALVLYLSFINLFLKILSILGRRR